MDAEGSIQVSLVLRFVDGIYEILDSHLIITVPDTAGNIILMMYGTCVIGHIPTTSKMLSETSDIVTIGIHQTKVTISLQQRCCQLRIRVQLVHLGLIGVGALHHIV